MPAMAKTGRNQPCPCGSGKAGVEALDVAVLPRAAPLDVSGLDADSCDPGWLIRLSWFKALEATSFQGKTMG
jgi:hypothetical protein